jgi:hypothetical protein
MNLENLVAIAGMPGIYRVITNKGNGIIVEDVKDKKRQFVSGRQGAVTPLETIFIYIDDAEEESTPLKNIYSSMLNQQTTTPPPTAKADDKAIKSYFHTVCPNLDRERVYVSDMKKMLKWFHFLNELNLLSLEETAEAEKEKSEQ